MLVFIALLVLSGDKKENVDYLSSSTLSDGIGENLLPHLRVKAHALRREHQLLLLRPSSKFPNLSESKNQS